MATTPLPPPRRSPGLRPALLVVGLAGALVLGFGALAAVTGSSPGPPGPPSRPPKAAGSSLRAVPARAVLAPIEHPGTPPADILDALAVPAGAVVGTHRNLNTSSTQYDEQMGFSVDATEAAVVSFYKAELKAEGWHVFDVGAASGRPGSVEVLAQKGSSDGWYWEAGAVVSPTTFGRRGAGQTTDFTLRLFQESDEE
jgi:hypothetical protein